MGPASVTQRTDVDFGCRMNVLHASSATNFQPERFIQTDRNESSDSCYYIDSYYSNLQLRSARKKQTRARTPHAAPVLELEALLKA